MTAVCPILDIHFYLRVLKRGTKTVTGETRLLFSLFSVMYLVVVTQCWYHAMVHQRHPHLRLAFHLCSPLNSLCYANSIKLFDHKNEAPQHHRNVMLMEITQSLWRAIVLAFYHHFNGLRRVSNSTASIGLKQVVDIRATSVQLQMASHPQGNLYLLCLCGIYVASISECIC